MKFEKYKHVDPSVMEEINLINRILKEEKVEPLLQKSTKRVLKGIRRWIIEKNYVTEKQRVAISNIARARDAISAARDDYFAFGLDEFGG